VKRFFILILLAGAGNAFAQPHYAGNAALAERYLSGNMSTGYVFDSIQNLMHYHRYQLDKERLVAVTTGPNYPQTN